MKPCRSEQICQSLAPLLYFGFYGLSSLHSWSFTEIMKHLHFLHNLIFPLEMLCVSPNSIVTVKQPFNMSMKHCKRCLFFWTPIFFVRQPFNTFRLPKIELEALMGGWCDLFYSVKKMQSSFWCRNNLSQWLKYVQKCPRICTTNKKIQILNKKWAKCQTKAQKSTKDDFIREIWWPVWESRRSVSCPGELAYMRLVCRICMWILGL